MLSEKRKKIEKSQIFEVVKIYIDDGFKNIFLSTNNYLNPILNLYLTLSHLG